MPESQRPPRTAAPRPVRLMKFEPVQRARVGRPLAKAQASLPDNAVGRLADRLRRLRTARGMSQAQLAAETHLNPPWHQTTVAKIERAERELRHQELLAVADALDITLMELLDLAPPDKAEAAATADVQRIEQERRAVQIRLDFVTEDLQDLESQQQELSSRLESLTEDLAKARRSLAEARRKPK